MLRYFSVILFQCYHRVYNPTGLEHGYQTKDRTYYFWLFALILANSRKKQLCNTEIGKEPIITIGGRVIKASITIMVGDNKIEPITSFKFDVNMDKENQITLLEEIKKLIPDDLNPEQAETLKKQIIEAL